MIIIPKIIVPMSDKINPAVATPVDAPTDLIFFLPIAPKIIPIIPIKEKYTVSERIPKTKEVIAMPFPGTDIGG